MSAPSAAATMRAAIDALSHAPSSTDALAHIRKLCVDAEGPGDAFARSTRGQQVLALIHVVVRSCGLSDKVGALTALRLLKTDDLALHAYASAGVIPALLKALESGTLDERGAAHVARSLSALASSPDVCKMLIRSGALNALTRCVERAAGADEARDDATYAADALTRVSERSSTLNRRRLFPISSHPSAVDLTCESAVESMVVILSSDVSVAHTECAIGLRDLCASGPAGRRAVARCGAVIPLVATALGGKSVRAACVGALRALAGDAMTNSGDAVDTIAVGSSGRGQDREDASMDEKRAYGSALAMGGLNFFHELIDVLTTLLRLRSSLEPAAADAALALWALVWQPSNKAHMVHERVTDALVSLAREGCATSRDDAMSVLSVLALDTEGRKAIYAQEQGAQVLDYLVAQEECSSPRATSQGLTFDEALSRRRSSSPSSLLGNREHSSSALSLAMSRLAANATDEQH